MWRAALVLGASVLLLGQSGILPLREVQPDQQGVAKTVFRGRSAEEFPLQILGVLNASGPGQNLILAKLLTPRLEQTGVMQGMSGSPVYIGGRLAGAIAFAFPFAKEPIAGIRPIEEMLALPAGGRRESIRAELHLGAQDLLAGWKGEARGEGPTPVLTPISFAGLSGGALAHFAPAWRRLGFAMQQGAAGNKAGEASGDIAAGDMISVQLLRGEMVAGADGTVTHRDGKRIYAFGHRFLAAGEVDFPFAKAEVLTPLPNYNTSFKISQSLAPAGAIRMDGDAGIVGMMGEKAVLTPLRLSVAGVAAPKTYQAEMVRHSLLSPLLLQMAVYSALDHHMRSAGSGTVEVEASVRYGGGLPALKIQGRYAGDANLPLAASLGVALPLAYVGQQAGDALLPEAVEVKTTATTDREQWVVEGLRLSRRVAKPGERVNVRVQLVAGEKTRSLEADFVVPGWLTPGESLTVTVQDAFTANLLDFRAFYQPGGPVFQGARELIETVNRLHPAGHLYLRILRTGNTYQSGVQEVGGLPYSLGSLFAKQGGQYGVSPQVKLLDREFVLPSGVVAGAKTATLEIDK